MERGTTIWLGLGLASLVGVIGLGMYLGRTPEAPTAPAPSTVAATPPPSPTGPPPEGSRLPQEAPSEVPADAWRTSESGLRVADLVLGDGNEAQNGAPLLVEYTGWLAETGELIDSTRRRARPMLFTLGEGDAPMPGWDEAVSGMRVGGKRQAVFPPELAFGQTGKPPRVPRNATVVFEFELIETSQPREAPTAPPAYEASALRELSGVQVVDLVEGTGRTVSRGDNIALDYSGFLARDGHLFDSSLTRSGPARFRFGGREMLPGVEGGIEGMKVGGKRLILIPPELGYGENGLRNYVPPQADLVFVVELVEIGGEPGVP